MMSVTCDGLGAVDPPTVFLTPTYEEAYCYGPIVLMRKLRPEELQ